MPNWLTYDFPPTVKAKVNRLWGGGEWHGQAQKWLVPLLKRLLYAILFYVMSDITKLKSSGLHVQLVVRLDQQYQ